MTRPLIITSVIGAILAIAVWAIRQPGAPLLMIETKVVDFGTIAPDSPVTRVIRIQNAGGRDLRVTTIASSCGCTIVGGMPNIIGPGRQENMTIQLTAPSMRGPFESSIAIKTNDPEDPLQKIQIKSVVLPEVAIEPHTFDFGLVSPDELPKTVGVRILTEDMYGRVQIGDPKTTTNWIGLAQSDQNDMSVKLYATLKPGVSGGVLSERVVVPYITATNQKKELTISVHGQVLSSVKAIPASLIIPVGFQNERSLKIHYQHKPVRILDITESESIKNLIEIKSKEDSDGGVRITIKITPAGVQMRPVTGSQITGKLHLLLEDAPPQEPELFQVPIVLVYRPDS